jgi:amino acid transporter
VLGALAAAAFAWVLLTNGLAWVMSSARSQAVACLDGAAPRALGRFSPRTGTPVRIIVAAGLCATATAVTGFAIAGDDADRYFSVVLTVSIALIALANLVVFPSLLRLRRTHAHMPRPFRIPGGSRGATLAALLATGWCALALIAALVPGIGSAHPDAALPAGFAGERLAFTASVVGPLLVLGAVAVMMSLVCGRGGSSGGPPLRAGRVEGPAGRPPEVPVRCGT